jgi:hypothetical protein
MKHGAAVIFALRRLPEGGCILAEERLPPPVGRHS